jgi:hypothetical protein
MLLLYVDPLRNSRYQRLHGPKNDLKKSVELTKPTCARQENMLKNPSSRVGGSTKLSDDRRMAVSYFAVSFSALVITGIHGTAAQSNQTVRRRRIVQH